MLSCSCILCCHAVHHFFACMRQSRQRRYMACVLAPAIGAECGFAAISLLTALWVSSVRFWHFCCTAQQLQTAVTTLLLARAPLQCATQVDSNERLLPVRPVRHHSAGLITLGFFVTTASCDHTGGCPGRHVGCGPQAGRSPSVPVQ